MTETARTNERTNERTNKRTDERTNKQTNERTNEQTQHAPRKSSGSTACSIGSCCVAWPAGSRLTSAAFSATRTARTVRVVAAAASSSPPPPPPPPPPALSVTAAVVYAYAADEAAVSRSEQKSQCSEYLSCHVM